MWNSDFKPDSGSGHFHLDKWYLDFAGDEGEAMIFYAACLSWRGFEVHYTSWLRYDPIKGVTQRSAFRNIHMPEKTNDLITWSDEKFGIWGRWEAIASPLFARLYDSDSGYLEWKCYQPASRVELVAGQRNYKGTGYAEQLILTLPPWKMPLHELRWGRFGSRENQLVWIEIREEVKQQWVWLNGIRVEGCSIEDDLIILSGKGLTLKLDKGVVLESENKINTVVDKLQGLLPGFKRIIPLQFLLAEECKWFSNGVLYSGDDVVSSGPAIHEKVNFKPTV